MMKSVGNVLGGLAIEAIFTAFGWPLILVDVLVFPWWVLSDLISSWSVIWYDYWVLICAFWTSPQLGPFSASQRRPCVALATRSGAQDPGPIRMFRNPLAPGRWQTESIFMRPFTSSPFPSSWPIPKLSMTSMYFAGPTSNGIRG